MVPQGLLITELRGVLCMFWTLIMGPQTEAEDSSTATKYASRDTP